MPATTRSALTRHVDEGTVPGVVATLGRDLDPVAVGHLTVGGPAASPDAIVRIQSMTKVVTAVAALRLVARGDLDLDAPVDHWVPELADRRVLVHPAAGLDETVPARRPITLRHLLTNMSGYGALAPGSPLADAMAANGTEADEAPPRLGQDDWLAALATLPLAVQPGEGWRYHHSFGILGILLGRVAGTSTAVVLADELFGPLGMTDTGFVVPASRAHRLPAAYRRGADGFEEIEPAGGGFYVAPPFEVGHAELVSTLTDLHAFLRALAAGELIPAELLTALRTDQVPETAKTPESFFPGFWDSTGWGYGVSVTTSGPSAGRWGWSGGLGTDFFVAPDGSIGILLAQVAMDERVLGMLTEFGALPTDG
ncbi:serine hydrolase domain-containing protein [Georgenia sp. Z1344]|uniref:serine hydrolase domain-containing protein n=1 Tax=Georgenia sp. Z1344 TaxID=3416706 RepID=UPI003CF69EF4